MTNPLQAMELESTLAVVSVRPETIAEEIAGLDKMAGFRLDSRPTMVLADVYWDLPDFGLEQHETALRLRSMGGNTWVALKGPGHRVGVGVLERTEFEEVWSRESLEAVLGLLKKIGVAPESPGSWDANAEQTMVKLGFRVSQRRETQRRPRVVSPIPTGADPVAELTIDTTRFHADDHAVRHREVEIEAYSPDSSRAVQELTKVLLARFPDELVPWEDSKLATGKALATLIARGELVGLFTETGDILPPAYSRLRSILGG